MLAGMPGRVLAIDNLQIARIARLAGAPLDSLSGIDLHRKLDDPVEQGEPLYTIYAEFLADFQFAKQAAFADAGYRIGSGP